MHNMHAYSGNSSDKIFIPLLLTLENIKMIVYFRYLDTILLF